MPPTGMNDPSVGKKLDSMEILQDQFDQLQDSASGTHPTSIRVSFSFKTYFRSKET